MARVMNDWSELSNTLATEKAAGKKVVFTNGVFDILHAGHLRSLQTARSLGDILVVGINSDESVKILKGDMRPIINQAERAEMLAGLSCVDYVSIFNENTPSALISKVMPDIHCKGGDYQISDLPEAAEVMKHGGEVVILPLLQGRSSTDIIAKLKQIIFLEGGI